MRTELLTQKNRSEAANIIPLEIIEGCELAEIVEERRPAVAGISGIQIARAGAGAVVWLGGAAWQGTKVALIMSGYVVAGVLLLAVELLSIVLDAVRGGLDRHGYHGRGDVQAHDGQGAGQVRTGSIHIINEVRTGPGANVRIENRVL